MLRGASIPINHNNQDKNWYFLSWFKLLLWVLCKLIYPNKEGSKLKNSKPLQKCGASLLAFFLAYANVEVCFQTIKTESGNDVTYATVISLKTISKR